MVLFISEGIYRGFLMCEALGGMSANTNKVRALFSKEVYTRDDDNSSRLQGVYQFARHLLCIPQCLWSQYYSCSTVFVACPECIRTWKLREVE